MPLQAAELINQWKRMQGDHQQWRPMWQDISDYILPKRSQFEVKRSPGQKQTEKLFDSTALDACDRLASTLNGTLTSRAAKWFTLRMRDSALNDIKEIDEWLEDCSSRMFRAFNQCNFAQEIHELYLDETALGTAGIFLEERNPAAREFDGFIFTTMPLHDFTIEENSEGRVDTIFRTFPLSAAACIRKWGNKVGDKIQKAFDDGKPETMFTILHAILPRDPRMPKLGTPATKKPWASAYVCMDDKYLIQEGGFDEFPCMVPRWSKTSGEQYGRGPGFTALPDIKTLNKIKEIALKVAAKLLAMPTKSREEGVVGKIRNTEGGNTVVRNMDDLAPLFDPGYFNEVLRGDQLKSEELRTSIRNIFYYDQLQLPVGVPMTATEVMKRFELLQRILGPTMGRQETELLNPLIDRAFGIMYRHGAFLPVPEELTKASDGKIDVQYEGPLAKSQRLAEAEGIEQIAQSVMQIAAVYPDILDTIDWEEGIRITADIRGVPSKVLRDPADIAKMRAQRAQQNQQQQQLANMSKVADAAGKATPAIQALTGAASGGAR